MRLARAMRIGVPGQHLSAGSAADGQRALGTKRVKMCGHFFAVSGDKNFAARLQKFVDALPDISDETGPRACCFENAGRGRESEAGHAVPIDVKGREPPGEECIVICRTNVPDVACVGWKPFRVPSRAAQQERSVRTEGS